MPVAERHETWVSLFEGMPSGPGWLGEARQAAFARFAERGLPTTREEEWRFTSLSALADTAFVSAGEAPIDRPAVAPFRLDDPTACQIVLVNGRLAGGLTDHDLPDGVTLTSLRAAPDAPAWPAALAAGQLNRAGGTAVLVDLNTALLEDAVLLDVAPGAIVTRPIHVLHVTAGADAPVVVSPRLIVRAGEQSQVSLIDSYVSLTDAGGFTNAVVQVSVAAGAFVDHVKLQRESTGTFHLATIAVEVGRAGVFRSHAITLGGRLVRNDILSRLDGEGAECTLNGLYVADGSSLVDTHTTIDHAEPHCPSHEVYKGILGGRARAVFNGKIIVRQKAQKTDAKQTNRALLLSDDAQVNTKPQLEIFADDVKCTHGAAIGQLDEDQLFYLRARGIAIVDARNMLIHAFAGDVLGGVRAVAVRELALRLVDEKLKLPHEESAA